MFIIGYLIIIIIGLLQTLPIISISNNTDDRHYQFSGIYYSDPNKTGVAEDFSAAWLMSKSRFNLSIHKISRSTNMAGVSFAATRNKCKNCIPVLTRDYLDFLVEHLSTTSNQIPYAHGTLFKVFNNRVKEASKQLKLKGDTDV